jgi:aminoglycoside phosphotransferase (APT) family kinase protein
MTKALVNTVNADGKVPFQLRLESALGRILHTYVSDLRQLSGGASQQTWLFKAHDRALVLRVQPEGVLPNPVSLAISLAGEATLMRRAREAEVPSPEVAHVLTPEDGLGPGFIQEFVEGETLGGRIAKSEALAAARVKLAYECGKALARIHEMDVRGLPELPVRNVESIVEDLRKIYGAERWPRPVFELAFRWLSHRQPQNVSQVRLVHGDFRNGNIIVGADGLRAVLDWELAYLGDPMADLGWLCTNSWRFGMIDLPVGGFGRRQDLYAGYEEITGRKVDAERVRFWEFVGSLRWGVMCTLSTVACREGSAVAVDRPMIARRASETELDLIEMMSEE